MMARNSQFVFLTSKIVRYRLFLLTTFFIILSCATGKVKIINTSGDVSLKAMNRQVIGISKMQADEQDALKDAFSHALSQIASFNGIAIAEEFSQEIINISGSGVQSTHFDNRDSLSVKRQTFSKSFFRLFQLQYYVESYRQSDWAYYKAWCYIPYNEQIKQRFFQTLIDEYQKEIEFVENELPVCLDKNPGRYPEYMDTVMQFYSTALSQSEAYFLGTNDLIIFLKQKIQKLQAESNYFFDHVNFLSQNSGLNDYIIEFFYQNKPIRLDFELKDISVPSLIDTFMVTWLGESAQIRIKPVKSGKTTVRIYPANVKFHGNKGTKAFDMVTDLKLVNKFADKKIGITIYDSKNRQFLPDASGLLGKVVSDLEGNSFSIQPGADAAVLGSAKAANCNLLITGEVDILDNRYNPQQEIYVVFPSLYLKVFDMISDKIIYQNSFPNDRIKANEMREFGNDSSQALKNGQSLRNLFQNELFIAELGNL